MDAIRVQLDVKQVAGQTGAELGKMSHLIDKWVEIDGTFVATLVLEGTIGGQSWATVATVSEPTTIEVAPGFSALRIRTTAYTSGTPRATLAARDSRGLTQIPTRF